MKMDICIDKYNCCDFCLYAKGCTEKDKYRATVKELREVAKKYEYTFSKIYTRLELKCRSYASQHSGYDSTDGEWKETDGVF